MPDDASADAAALHRALRLLALGVLAVSSYGVTWIVGARRAHRAFRPCPLPEPVRADRPHADEAGSGAHPPVVLVGVMPCTRRDADWIVAKLESCQRTLDARALRALLIAVPRKDLSALKAALRERRALLPAHWHIVAEDEIVPMPRKPARRRDGASAPRGLPQRAPRALRERASARRRARPWARARRRRRLAAAPLPAPVAGGLARANGSAPVGGGGLAPAAERSWRGWNLQQAVKLLAYRHPLASALGGGAPATHVLTLDADVLCARGWSEGLARRGAAAGGAGAPARRPLPRAFVRPDGRVLTCLESTFNWHGAWHVSRTAAEWGLADWAARAQAGYELERGGARVLGWTPQILHVDGLRAMEAELLRLRGPAEAAAAGAYTRGSARVSHPAEVHALAGLLRRGANWTEYATYFLLLQRLQLWARLHVQPARCSDARVEPASGRCAMVFNASWRPPPPAARARKGAWTGARGAARADAPGQLERHELPHPSLAVAGCLKVRADCDEEVVIELQADAVPFVTVNDHALNGSHALALVRRAFAPAG